MLSMSLPVGCSAVGGFVGGWEAGGGVLMNQATCGHRVALEHRSPCPAPSCHPSNRASDSKEGAVLVDCQCSRFSTVEASCGPVQELGGIAALNPSPGVGEDLTSHVRRMAFTLEPRLVVSGEK